MKINFVRKQIDYSGAELRSHFAYNNFGLRGDSIVAFVGGCDISLEHMVDLEDVKSRSKIYSEKMLHFIAEFFDHDLEKAILRQRLLISIIKDEISKKIGNKKFTRRGDDLYDGPYKLTISIATLSPVSSLIHAGINISSKNTPVRTRGLADYKIDPENLALPIMKSFAGEMKSIYEARCKVKGVV